VREIQKHICILAVTLLTLSIAPDARAQVTLVGMGDSIGEGVQSADANSVTQLYSFVNLIASRFGATFPLPLIRTGLFAGVTSTQGRSRLDPSVRTRNLSVSGADVNSILFDAATATSVAQIDTETELVLFPETGSQIDVAERLNPEYAVVWIGNNDALGAALAYDQLDATQLTPVADFTPRFAQLVERIDAMGTKAVFGTIPDISGIGYLMNGSDLVRFLGSSYGLPAGSLTSLGAMVQVRLGLEDPAIFSDPDYVLDPAEQAIISNHIGLLNDVIRSTVWAHGMAVADTHAVFEFLSAGPLNLFGIPLTTRFLGGLFSLDGVHPSNTGQGIAAMFFIDALNQRYGTNIPQIDAATLFWLVQTDPHVDRDRDGRVTGRFGGGLLETVFSVMGITGDASDVAPAGLSAESDDAAPAHTTAARPHALSEAARQALFEAYAKATGKDLRWMSRADRMRAIHELFGTARLAR
jgi:lysophospholipase L1-like esterase